MTIRADTSEVDSPFLWLERQHTINCHVFFSKVGGIMQTQNSPVFQKKKMTCNITSPTLSISEKLLALFDGFCFFCGLLELAGYMCCCVFMLCAISLFAYFVAIMILDLLIHNHFRFLFVMILFASCFIVICLKRTQLDQLSRLTYPFLKYVGNIFILAVVLYSFIVLLYIVARQHPGIDARLTNLTQSIQQIKQIQSLEKQIKQLKEQT